MNGFFADVDAVVERLNRLDMYDRGRDRAEAATFAYEVVHGQPCPWCVVGTHWNCARTIPARGLPCVCRCRYTGPDDQECDE